MKALIFIVAAAWFAASAAAQETVPSTPPAKPPPAPEAAPVQPPAAKPPEPAPKAQPAPAESGAVRQAQQTLLPALVSVRIQALEEPEAKYEDRSQIDVLFDEVVRERLPVRVAGVRVNADGLVLIRDPNLPLRRYGEITATDSTGAAVPMQIASVLENYAAVLLEPKTPAKALPFLAFEKADLKTGDKFLFAEPAFIEGALIFGLSEEFASSVAVEGAEKHLQLIWWQEPTYNEILSNAAPSTAPVVFDAAARPIGIALDNSLWSSGDGADSWIGARIMADGRLTPAALEANAGKIKTVARTAIKEIEIQFRDANRLPPALRLDEGRLMAYGLLLDKSGTIFIPTELDRNQVRLIERITVLDGDRRLDGRFQGMFRDFGGIVVRASNVTGEPAALADQGMLARGKLFYSLSVRRRFGARFEDVEYNRYLDVATGYKEARYAIPRKPLRAGDFLADAGGRLLGFCAPFRKEREDEIRAGEGRNPQAAPRPARPFLFSDVAAVLREPQTHYDPDARPTSRKEEGRLVWLGVEFQPMNPLLARVVGAENATRGGARGLLVTDVYDDSPAAKNGIKTGDILLSINLAGRESEVDLATPGEGRQPDIPGRLWRRTFNYLTAVLTQIGPGHEIRLRLLHDRKEAVLALTLEKEPDNFDIADRFSDASMGLGVRELTYEVRRVLRLPPNAPGVVVGEVQPGSKAAVAQIAPCEIISMVNGAPAKNLKEFERLVRAAEVTGKIEFIVTNLGVERIVEVNLSAAP